MPSQPWMWAVFSAVVLALLALDLGVFNRRAHTPSTREAVAWSAAWVSLAALFGLWFGRTGG